MKIYIVRASGVYLKDISMATCDKDKAIECCNDLALKDVDSYHYWNVTEHTLGEVFGLGKMKLDNLHDAIYKTDKNEQIEKQE